MATKRITRENLAKLVQSSYDYQLRQMGRARKNSFAWRGAMRRMDRAADLIWRLLAGEAVSAHEVAAHYGRGARLSD